MDEENKNINNEEQVNVDKVEQKVQKVQEQSFQEATKPSIDNYQFEQQNIEKQKWEIEDKKKKAFVLSCLGLLLDLVLGIGAIFSLISLILSLKNPDKDSSSIKWSTVLSIIGLILGVVFFIAVIYYVVTHPVIIPNINDTIVP